MKVTDIEFRLNFFILILLLWILLVGLSYYMNIRSIDTTIHDLALNAARVSYQKDLLYRRWATIHGGVYVPLTDETPPNPYLNRIEEREITTESGRNLTLMNPAYMTRQVHELGAELYKLKAHITSLNPIRPENAPDEWEIDALKLFKSGQSEYSSIAVLDEQHHLRYMKVLKTEQGCLKCHEEQGFKVGDIRGGLSVSVPLSDYAILKTEYRRTSLFTHLILFAVGVFLLLAFTIVISRKTAEKNRMKRSLNRAHERYRLAVEGSSDGIWDWNIKREYVYFSPRFKAILGYAEDEIENEFSGLERLIYDEDLQMARAYILDHLGGGTEQLHTEFRMKHKSGRLVDVLFRAALIMDTQGEPERMVGTLTDLSLLRHAEKKYQQLFENMRNGFALHRVITDGEGQPVDYIVTDVNPAYEKLIGLKREDIINKNIRSVIPDVEDQWIRESGEVALTGRSITTENYSRALGKFFSISVFSPGLGEFAAVFEDVTSRKKQEELISKSLEEKGTLLKELYHRTQNNMQVISGFLRLQSLYADNDEVSRQLDDAENRVISMSVVHQKLYQSKNLSNIDMKEYITDLCRSLLTNYRRPNDSVRADLKIETSSASIDIAIPVGLVLNELITNCLKHAFPQNKGCINISLTALYDNKTRLIVRDDGRGLPEGLNLRRLNTLGLQTVFNIIEKQLDGEIEYFNDNGAVFDISFRNDLYVERI